MRAKLENGELFAELEDFLMSSSEAFKRTIKKRFIVSTTPAFSSNICPPEHSAESPLQLLFGFAFVLLGCSFLPAGRSESKEERTLAAEGTKGRVN